LQLTLKPSRGPSRSGAQASFGTRAGATIGMAAVATTTGADMDPTPITGIPVVLAIMAGMATVVVLAIMADLVTMVVLAIMVGPVGPVVLAVTADR
jgi:hypothetical protein